MNSKALIKNILLKLKGCFLKEKTCVGLDIGTSAIKIIKLKFSKDVIKLCDFSVEPFKIDSPEALNKIKKALEPVGLVNISVGGSQTVLRYANFPKMNSIELRQAFKFEAQKHIPFSVSEVNLDGYILKEGLADNKMLVLIAAAKKELVAGRIKLIEGAGLSTHTVDMDSVALINTFLFNNLSLVKAQQKAVALLNIGASVSNLNILEEGIPRLSRDVHIAGNNLTQKIADVFGIDFSNAEILKFNPEGEPDKLDKVNLAVEAVMTNLCAELRTSFDYYESQGAGSVVKIYLSGGGSKFSGLREMLAHLLDLEVEYWNPLQRLSVNESINAEKLKAASSQLAVALGLALRS